TALLSSRFQRSKSSQTELSRVSLPIRTVASTSHIPPWSTPREKSLEAQTPIVTITLLSSCAFPTDTTAPFQFNCRMGKHSVRLLPAPVAPTSLIERHS